MKAILLLLAVPGILPLAVRAETGSGESSEFPVETGSARSVAAMTTAQFPVDLRDKGGVAATGSAEFVLNTLSGLVDSVVIDTASVPQSVVPGAAYPFHATAHFLGGASMDVSQSAGWFIMGDSPPGTHFERPNLLVAGPVSQPVQIRVGAGFAMPTGYRMAAPVTVTIQPGADYRLVVSHTSDGPSLILRNYDLTCDATTFSPQGPASSQSVFWDLDQDGEFDDATGLHVEKTYDAGRTVRIGARAVWLVSGPNGSQAVEASNYFFVTFPKPRSEAEPPTGLSLDSVNGAFMNSTGQAQTPDPGRKANGLVLITHGLNGSGTDGWPGDMADAIATRMAGTSAPNVAIYDWHTMADAGQNGTGINLGDIRHIRPNGRAQGIVMADWVDAQQRAGRVDKDAPLHLIGHSAGGFVVGETARILDQRGYSRIQVTMLDTPLPYQEHITPAWRTERYVTSALGGRISTAEYGRLWNGACNLVNSKVDWFVISPAASGSSSYLGGELQFPQLQINLRKLVPTGPKYYRTEIDPHTQDQFTAHSAAHQYYIATVQSTIMSNATWTNDVANDGFNRSLLVNDDDFAPSQPTARAPRSPAPPPPAMEDFLTFGTVLQTGTLYQATEQDNAGIFKSFTLPQWAATLQFKVRVGTPGDGDFVSVHWNDDDALAIIPETALAYDTPLHHELDITSLGGQTGTLTIKLNSRNASNSVVEISEVRILESDDLDGDGLTNTSELAAGSDPRNMDTDQDGLGDADEVQTYHTNPASGDTDGDRMGDMAEIAAGTNPLDAASRIVLMIGPVTPGISAPLVWNGVAGRTYRVVRCRDLQWLDVDYLKTSIPGVNGTMSYTDPEPPRGKAFYRVEVE